MDYPGMLSEVPEAWKAILKTVKTRMPEAVLAGGCLRDMIVLPDSAVKDLDIFITTQGRRLPWIAEALMDLFPAIQVRPLSSLETYHVNFTEVREVWNIIGVGLTPIQVIALDMEVTPFAIMQRCDFGICRISYDGRVLHLHDHFLQDLRRREFTLRRNTVPFSHAVRWQGFKHRFPGWRIVAPELKGLIDDDLYESLL